MKVCVSAKSVFISLHTGATERICNLGNKDVSKRSRTDFLLKNVPQFVMFLMKGLLIEKHKTYFYCCGKLFIGNGHTSYGRPL
jgi:hypothetical protein